jgi:hypothetical protein
MRVAVLGLTHDYIWSNLRNLAKFAGTEIVSGSRAGREAARRFASEHGKNWREKKQKSEG